MWVFAFQGLDLTSAIITGAIRPVPDGGGSPLITLLSKGTPDLEGFCITSITTETVDFGTVNGVYVGPLSVRVTYVQLRIFKATAEAFPYSIERDGEDLDLFWDMHIQPNGGDDYRQLEGPFTVHLGATGSS